MLKILIAAALAVTAAGANAQTLAQRYPSCDLRVQHAVKGHVGAAITDPRQAHIAVRADVLQADLGSARIARSLTQQTTDRLYRRVAAVRAAADRFTKRQGFLSAGEAASYDHDFDAVAGQLCRR